MNIYASSNLICLQNYYYLMNEKSVSRETERDLLWGASSIYRLEVTILGIEKLTKFKIHRIIIDHW